MSADHPIVIIPGDGIGPEITDAVLRILGAAHAPLRYVRHLAGLAALEAGEDVLPAETLDAIGTHGVALKGPCTTPIARGFTSVNVQLRQKLDLFSAIRPVRSLTGVKTRYEGVDLVIFRENTEGLYSGIENEITPGVVTSLKIVTKAGSTRIARSAFQYVLKRGRRKISVFHKANIMKLSDGLFLDCVQRVHDEEFPEVDYETRIIDAGCMKLIQDPNQFDVLLMENFYGDVVSDLAAGLVGGLGMVPGANIGNGAAIFEAVHGSAPDIAGRGIANPLALLMSAVMMLKHLHETTDDSRCKTAAVRIKSAYDLALTENLKTHDLGGNLGTDDFGDVVIARLP